MLASLACVQSHRHLKPYISIALLIRAKHPEMGGLRSVEPCTVGVKELFSLMEHNLHYHLMGWRRISHPHMHIPLSSCAIRHKEPLWSRAPWHAVGLHRLLISCPLILLQNGTIST